MITILNKMSMKRAEAIDRCSDLGLKFIEHFHKIYNNPNSQSIDHWIVEMQSWFNKILSITLKPDSRPLLNTQINDWFFTNGASPEDFMSNPIPDFKEIQAYDNFCFVLLSNKDIRNSLKSVGIIN